MRSRASFRNRPSISLPQRGAPFDGTSWAPVGMLHRSAVTPVVHQPARTAENDHRTPFEQVSQFPGASEQRRMTPTLRAHLPFVAAAEGMAKKLTGGRLHLAWGRGRALGRIGLRPDQPDGDAGGLVPGRYRASEGAKARYASKDTSRIVPLAVPSGAPSEKTTT